MDKVLPREIDALCDVALGLQGWTQCRLQCWQIDSCKTGMVGTNICCSSLFPDLKADVFHKCAHSSAAGAEAGQVCSGKLGKHVLEQRLQQGACQEGCGRAALLSWLHLWLAQTVLARPCQAHCFLTPASYESKQATISSCSQDVRSE